MPILGIYASSQQPALNANSYESIATVTVGAGGSSSVSFTSIPSTYTHLQLRWSAQTNRATYNIDDVIIRFNSDSGTNYSTHRMLQYPVDPSSTIIAQAYSNTTAMYLGPVTSSVATNFFSASVTDILDYANTNKYKTFKTISGCDTGGAASGYSGVPALNSGNWRSTSAITSITITPEYGSLITQYSTFSLYGIKAA
jgi:hypothetical protein